MQLLSTECSRAECSRADSPDANVHGPVRSHLTPTVPPITTKRLFTKSLGKRILAAKSFWGVFDE